MIAYKGTDMNGKCRGMQYEVGKEYTADGDVSCCKNGLHACEAPLDVFNHYPPASSRYFEVEPSGEISRGNDDTKLATRTLNIKAEIGIPGIVKAQIEYVKKKIGFDEAIRRANEEKENHATGNLGAASATGDRGAASATGKAGVALAAGNACKAMGALGCAICCVERGEWDGETCPIIAVKAAIVDGETIMPGVWYALENGEFKEVTE
uniref:DUF7666 domain-containing protein n=1 Tax=Siphoviridae sp. ctSMg55 TaxID=2825509 RepID=A0A8S5V4R1_9CAUD|nr:MAG TPA: hypothetical protein [Siphoviridae sp. ctSMg55]